LAIADFDWGRENEPKKGFRRDPKNSVITLSHQALAAPAQILD